MKYSCQKLIHENIKSNYNNIKEDHPQHYYSSMESQTRALTLNHFMCKYKPLIILMFVSKLDFT